MKWHFTGARIKQWISMPEDGDHVLIKYTASGKTKLATYDATYSVFYDMYTSKKLDMPQVWAYLDNF